MTWWRERVVPRLIDKLLSTDEVAQLRGRVCAGLSGDVLEVGFGSGLNLPHYPDEVTGVWAVEPSDLAWRLAQPRITAGGFPVERAGLDGARLDLPDGRYDAVVSTFTMCTIPDLEAALGEIRRVLRPGGSLHFVEHGLNRPIADRVRGSDLAIEELDTFYMKGPKCFGYTFLGHART